MANGTTLQADGPEVKLNAQCSIQNLLLHSNDLTNAAWLQQTGFTSVTKDQVDPFGVANNACRLTGGNASSLVLRQNISGASISDDQHFCVSGWVKRVSGTKLVDFDIGDGSSPKTRRVAFPIDNEWYFFWLVAEAGANSWLDINFPTGVGDGTFDFYGLQLNEGNTPFLYTDTTTAKQDRDYDIRLIKQSDFWRVGNDVV